MDSTQIFVGEPSQLISIRTKTPRKKVRIFINDTLIEQTIIENGGVSFLFSMKSFGKKTLELKDLSGNLLYSKVLLFGLE